MVWVNVVVQGILLGGLYALFATGLSLVFGVMRLVNLAHGDLIVLASFLSAVLVDNLGWNPLTTLVLVIPIMAALGFALQYLLLNFTLDSGLAPLLATFGLVSHHPERCCSSSSPPTRAGSTRGRSRPRASTSRATSRSAGSR